MSDDHVWTHAFRKGQCSVCGRHNVERHKTFSAATDKELRSKVNAWQALPLTHKRCEPEPPPAWIEHFTAWAEGREDILDFRGAVVPKRVQDIIQRALRKDSTP